MAFFQLLSMDPTEKEWLSVHMGHSKEVHDKFYRQHADVIELAKISKVLYLSESGNINMHKGQKLSELDVNDSQLSFDRVIETIQENDRPADGAQEDNNDVSSAEEEAPRAPRRQHASGKRLTKQERDDIFEYFKEAINNRKYAAMRACKEFNIATRRDLDYQQIRNCVNSKVRIQSFYCGMN